MCFLQVSTHRPASCTRPLHTTRVRDAAALLTERCASAACPCVLSCHTCCPYLQERGEHLLSESNAAAAALAAVACSFVPCFWVCLCVSLGAYWCDMSVRSVLEQSQWRLLGRGAVDGEAPSLSWCAGLPSAGSSHCKQHSSSTRSLPAALCARQFCIYAVLCVCLC